MLPQFITFTGLDLKTDLVRAIELSDRYPIEWGILYGGIIGYSLSKRYPGESTINAFLATDLRLAVHLCGRFARYALNPFMDDSADIISRLEVWSDARRPFRFQINATSYDIDGLIRFRQTTGVPVIMQTRGDRFPEPLDGITFLHDESGGRGIESMSRPRQEAATLVGYAGGIGPHNVRRVVAGIDACTYYLDMESLVRTDDWLDLNKCEAVCREIWS
jgi:hypothetical protein